jgi:ribosomal protein S18 acetylase RimI-like enzyme
MIEYRPFRNSDPPALLEVWNECGTGRGFYPLRLASLFDRWILSKPYFEREHLLVATDSMKDHRIVGFVLSGFGPNEERTALDKTGGVICCTMVRPEYRRRGIGTVLTQKAEAYLQSQGAEVVVYGSQRPFNPYLFGLYGGANSPGVLGSEPLAEPFLNKLGYQKAEHHIIFQRRLDTPFAVSDPRFQGLRRRYDIQMIRPTISSSWWEECLWGLLEPTEFRLVDKMTGQPAGRAVHWDLEGFSWRWNMPACGLFDIEIRAHLRRQGLAKFLLASILKLLQDQFFAAVELQVYGDEPAGIGICQSLGFTEVDRGYRYRKAVQSQSPPDDI